MRVEVWDLEDAQTPLQTITESAHYAGSRVWADDINFDGHPDIHFDIDYFEQLYLLWDEEAGCFIRTDQLNGLRAPTFDQEQQTVVDNYYSMMAITRILQWEGDELKLVRRITVEDARYVEGLAALCQAEVYLPDYDPLDNSSRYSLLTVEERGYLGEMQVVYMEVMDNYHPTFEADCTFQFDPRWYDLQYNGRS